MSCSLKQKRCGWCRGFAHALNKQLSSFLSSAAAASSIVTRRYSYADEDAAESFYCCAWGADCITGGVHVAAPLPI